MHSTGVWLLHESGTYDGLVITDLVALEIIMRKALQIEYYHLLQRAGGKLGGKNKKQGAGSIGDEILAAAEAVSGL